MVPPLEGAIAAQPPSAQTRTALVLACLVMSLAAVHRVTFSVLAVPIQAQLGLSLVQMGVLQSSLLAGYVVGQVGRCGPAGRGRAVPHGGASDSSRTLQHQCSACARLPPRFAQIPCGILADRFGGGHLAAAGLFLWSAACWQTSGAAAAAHPFPMLLAARAAMGLAQSCIMPATSALAARWFPPSRRSRYTSAVYGSYSVGTVAGLALAPLVAEVSAGEGRDEAGTGGQ
jgi:MFS family permease